MRKLVENNSFRVLSAKKEKRKKKKKLNITSNSQWNSNNHTYGQV